MSNLENLQANNALLDHVEITNSVNKALAGSALLTGVHIVFGEETAYAADGRISTGSDGVNGSGEDSGSEDGTNGTDGASSEDGQNGEASVPGRNAESVTGEEDGEDVEGTADGTNGSNSDDAKDGTAGGSSLATFGNSGNGEAGKPSEVNDSAKALKPTTKLPPKKMTQQPDAVSPLPKTAKDKSSNDPAAKESQRPETIPPAEEPSNQGGSIHENDAVVTNDGQSITNGSALQTELQLSKPILREQEAARAGDNVVGLVLGTGLILTGLWITFKSNPFLNKKR